MRVVLDVNTKPGRGVRLEKTGHRIASNTIVGNIDTIAVTHGMGKNGLLILYMKFQKIYATGRL